MPVHQLPVHRLPLPRLPFHQPRVMCSLSREGADSAAVVAADGRAGGDADGREHDNLKCPPSNSTIWSTDCEIRR